MFLSKMTGACGLTIVSLLLVSCSGGGKVRKSRADCSERLTQAKMRLDKGSYGSAKAMLEDIRLQCAGADNEDTVQKYLGDALLHMKMYAEARLEYTRLVQDFPRSAFHDAAQFGIAYCVFKQSRSPDRDQTETIEAQRLLKDLLESSPSGPVADSAQKYLKLTVEKLAEKEFNAAKFYQKTGEKEAAVIYYKSFIKEYPGSSLAAQARLNMGEILIGLNRKAEAREVLGDLIAQENKSDLAAKARVLLDRCKE